MKISHVLGVTLAACLLGLASSPASAQTTRAEIVANTGSFAQTSGVAVAGPGPGPVSAASASSHQSSGNYGQFSSRTTVNGGNVSTRIETNNSSYTNGYGEALRVGNAGAEATYYGDANGYAYERVTIRRRR